MFQSFFPSLFGLLLSCAVHSSRTEQGERLCIFSHHDAVDFTHLATDMDFVWRHAQQLAIALFLRGLPKCQEGTNGEESMLKKMLSPFVLL